MAWDWSGTGAGAVGGAGAGSAFGPIGTAIGGGLGALTGGIFGGQRQSKASPIQKKQQELIDQLLSSLNGNGPYADLFSASEEDFNRAYRDPALAQFKNVTAPTIQGAYTGGQYGQQRADSTGVQDSLARAGIDMDQLLNQAWGQYQNKARERQMNAMNKILGYSGGEPYSPSFSEQFIQGGGIGKSLGSIGESYRQKQLTDERAADRAQRQQWLDQGAREGYYGGGS